MSSWQLGLVVTSGLLNARLLPATSYLVSHAQQFAWLSSALAGLLFYLAAYFILRLAEHFPEETLGEYTSRLVGKRLGSVIIAFFILVMYLNIVNCTIAIVNVFSLYLLDQTPRQILIIVLLLAAAYCTLQEWGVILRVIQLLAISVPLLFAFYSLIFLNFNLLNLLPLWPDSFGGIIRGIFDHTDYYPGYESILVLLPLARRGTVSFAKTIGWGFFAVTLMYVLGAIIFIGAVSAKTGANVSEPVIYALKSVELPGTFIERLEDYMIMFFMPATYISMVLSYFSIGEVCHKWLKFNNHQTFVPVFLPLLFFVCNIVDSPEQREILRNISMYITLLFSFGITLLLLLLAKRRKGSSEQCFIGEKR
ncbi:MAG: spore germination protein [Pelosinus sp.]|nr:spore germination protein [Pelosinus sp.]